MKKLRGNRHLWLPYIRAIADQFGLKDWKIEVSGEDPRDGCVASVWVSKYRRNAVVYLSDQHLKDTPEEQRDTILHELIHLHFHGLLWFVDDRTTKKITPSVEVGVDSLSVAIAPHYPLPNIKR